jgi:hypothetical protein
VADERALQVVAGYVAQQVLATAPLLPSRASARFAPGLLRFELATEFCVFAAVEYQSGQA